MNRLFKKITIISFFNLLTIQYLHCQVYELEAEAVFIYRPEMKSSHFFSPSNTVIFKTIKNNSDFCYSYFVVYIHSKNEIFEGEKYLLKVSKKYFSNEELELKKLPFNAMCEFPLLIDMGDEFYLKLEEIQKVN